MIKTVRPETFDFYVEIEFPPSQQGVISAQAMRMWRTDALPAVEIKSCEGLTIHMDAEGIVWAEALMWAWPADQGGGPIFDGKPLIKDNQIITAVFNVHVAKVLSRSSYNKGYEEGYVQLHGKPLSAAKKMRGRRVVEA